MRKTHLFTLMLIAFSACTWAQQKQIQVCALEKRVSLTIHPLASQVRFVEDIAKRVGTTAVYVIPKEFFRLAVASFEATVDHFKTANVRTTKLLAIAAEWAELQSAVARYSVVRAVVGN